LLAISLAGNVILGLAFFRLTSGSTLPAAAQAPRPSGPEPGTQLPAMDVQQLAGPRETIAFSSDARPTLIYVFTPSCQWCEKNLDNVKAVLAAAKESHRIVAVSLDPDAEAYVRDVELGVPVYVNPSREVFESYGLGPTPQTLIVSPQGKVLKSWTGAYAGRMKKEVEEYFGTALPGFSRAGTLSRR
jgi:peroxiredoxin